MSTKKAKQQRSESPKEDPEKGKSATDKEDFCFDCDACEDGRWVLPSIYIPAILYLMFYRHWKIIVIFFYLWDSVRRIFLSYVIGNVPKLRTKEKVSRVSEFMILHPLFAVMGATLSWTFCELFDIPTLDADSSDWLFLQGFLMIIINWLARYDKWFYVSGIAGFVYIIIVFFWNGSEHLITYLLWGQLHLYLYAFFIVNLTLSWKWMGVAGAAYYVAILGFIKGMAVIG